jgi:hypothetical protein
VQAQGGGACEHLLTHAPSQHHSGRPLAQGVFLMFPGMPENDKDPTVFDVDGERGEVWTVTSWDRGCVTGWLGVFDSEEDAKVKATEMNARGGYSYIATKEQVHATYKQEKAEAS